MAVRGTVAVLYCALRESARMRSGEDGSLGTVNAEDGVFGCKTYGKPITRKIDIRKAYGELEDAARDLVRNLPQDTAGASAATSTALQPRYLGTTTSRRLGRYMLRICMKYQNIFCRLRIRNNVCITVWGRSQVPLLQA